MRGMPPPTSRFGTESTEIKGIVCVAAALLFLFYPAGAVNRKTDTSLSIHSSMLMSNP